jgi:iron complex outermembrane receptor protein
MKFSSRLKLSGSAISLAVITSLSSHAQAQDAPAPAAPATEQVVVTGTSIRGVAPVGSDLITVSPADIQATGAQNVQDLLTTVPALLGMGSAGQGQSGGAAYQPVIHQLGSSASNSTLVLIDGHRFPTGGTNHSEPDPGLLPFNMLERVDVLPDGASSIYGSDAIAGVVNFITRKKFDGVMVSGQSDFMDGKTDWEAGILTGTSWSNGSAMFAYTYTHDGMLMQGARPYTFPNHIAQGGTNFNNFNCDPSTIQPNGAGNIYLSPTSATNVANTAANSPCSTANYSALVPQTVRNNVMLKMEQDFGDNWTVTSEFVYGNRRDQLATSRGTLTATAFQTGTQANPFYINPPGVSATKQTIRWDADALFGPGAFSVNGADTFYGDANVEYKLGRDFLGGDFVVDFLALVGQDTSYSGTVGTVNASAAELALNGTTNSNGSLTTPVAGLNAIITQLPLTAANALDVWDPASSNQTSATVKAALLNNGNTLSTVTGNDQFRLSTNGTLLNLPAGPLKVAFGAELFRWQSSEFTAQPLGSGPASTGTYSKSYDFNRTVRSVYGEFDVPLVDEGMNVPLMQSLEVDVSGRYDHYSDFGDTANPKIGVNWHVVGGLKARASISTSFVAPPLDLLGDANGIHASQSYFSTTNNVNVPVALFPAVATTGIAGCTAASVTCNISSLQGIQANSGNHNMKAILGRGWSVGFDYTPDYIPGLTGSFTYWEAGFEGGVTGPQIGFVVNNASLANLLTFYPAPAGATSAQIGAKTQGLPQSGALPTVVSYILQTINSNYLNLREEGIDLAANYIYDTPSWGTFNVGDTMTLLTEANQSYGTPGVGETYSILNTSGANTSFPTIAMQMRASLGWTFDDVMANFFVNYTGAYRNWNSTAVSPVTVDALGYPSGGGDHVAANVTFDLHLAYNFQDGILGDDSVSLNIRNVTDQTPPFLNVAAGYDSSVANVLGRVISVGLQSKF